MQATFREINSSAGETPTSFWVIDRLPIPKLDFERTAFLNALTHRREIRALIANNRSGPPAFCQLWMRKLIPETQFAYRVLEKSIFRAQTFIYINNVFELLLAWTCKVKGQVQHKLRGYAVGNNKGRREFRG